MFDNWSTLTPIPISSVKIDRPQKRSSKRKWTSLFSLWLSKKRFGDSAVNDKKHFRKRIGERLSQVALYDELDFMRIEKKRRRRRGRKHHDHGLEDTTMSPYNFGFDDLVHSQSYS
jgi:hypothetical protein